MGDAAQALRIFSYGGGVQSTAALVLSTQGKIDFPAFVFANVGDDSEHPATLRYVREIAMPYAREHGVTLEEVRWIRRDGSFRSLRQLITHPDNKSVHIPARLSGGHPARRNCTIDFKIAVLGKWQRAHGASKANPAIVGLGISWDELRRMRTNTDEDRIILYPLIDLRLTRLDCMAIIAGAGLPVPNRSSCYFCPYHTQRQWQHMRHHEPELFSKAVEIEQTLSARQEALGHGPITMHAKGPLMDITSASKQLDLFEQQDTCESGYCMV